MAKKQSSLTELQIIGLNIRKIRETQNISRLQLAYEIDTTEKQLSRIEYGEINSGVMSYIKIARALNVPIDELFKKVKF
ncbi:MAG TPA: helix-turn-helix transcriptional regulator [Bacteroidia bacterium]|nr:helix-turn-helix transcriptional regulator [Bacteroidia bacterium]